MVKPEKASLIWWLLSATSTGTNPDTVEKKYAVKFLRMKSVLHKNSASYHYLKRTRDEPTFQRLADNIYRRRVQAHGEKLVGHLSKD